MSTAETPAASAGTAAVVDTLKKELDFVRRLLSTAKTVDEVVAAARCAARVANNAKHASNQHLPRPGQPGASGPTFVLLNLPAAPEWGWLKVRKFLNEVCGVRVMRIEKAMTWDFAIVSMGGEEEKVAAMAAIAGKSLQGAALAVEDGQPTPERMEELKKGGAGKRAREEGDA